MKLRPFITHTVAISAGALGTLAYVTSYSLPEVANYASADPTYMQFRKEQEPEWYSLVLSQALLGKMYLTHPLYFHKRKEGLNILEKIGNRGHAPTSVLLADYYMLRAIDGVPNSYSKSYYWAKKAAEQGKPLPLLGDVTSNDETFRAELVKAGMNIDNDLAFLGDIARNSYSNSMARILSKYYDIHNEPEKSKYWHDISIELYDDQRAEPVCKTLSPGEL